MNIFSFLVDLLSTSIRVPDYLNTIILWLYQCCSTRLELSRSKKVDLIYFVFLAFLFYFQFIFLFSIFRTTRVRVDQSHCQSPDGVVTRQITGLGRIQQKILEQIMSYNMDYTWLFRIECTVLSMDYLQNYIRLTSLQKSSLLSSLVLLNTRVVLLSNSKDFSP